MLRYLCVVLLAALLTIPNTNVVASEMVVIASTSPDFISGRVVEDGGSISIPPGTKLTLIAPDGDILTIEGPYEGIPGTNAESITDTSLISSLSTLFSVNEDKLEILGAMRSGTIAQQSNPWAINVTGHHKQCVSAIGLPELWRPNVNQNTDIVVSNEKTGIMVKMKWPQDSETMEWPSEINFSNGATYTFHLSALGITRKVNITFVPTNLPSEPHKAAWMAQQDCTEQAKLILSALE